MIKSSLAVPSTARSPARSQPAWRLGLPLLLAAVYGLGALDWPPGPLFALRLALQPFALLALLWLGALGLGDLVLEALRLPLVRGERLLFSAGLGLITWWLALLALGLLGFFQVYVAWALLLGFGLIGLWRVPLMLTSLVLSRPRLSLWSFLLGLAFVSAALYPLFAHGLLPPLEWDEMAYHLAIPKMYVAAGRIINIPFIVHSNWPFGIEMLYTLALLLGSQAEVLAHLLQWSLALLTAAGLAYSGSGQRRRMGLLAAALWLTLPIITRISGTGLIDTALAAFSWLALMAWWRWHATRDNRWLLLAGLLAGGAASVKLTGASVAVLLSAMTLLAHTGVPWRTRLVAAVLVGLVALAIVSPWYLKSWTFAGDPVWPFGYKLFPARNWDALGARYLDDYARSVNLPLTPANYVSAPALMILHPERFGGFSLGYVLPLLVPLALLELRREKLLRWLLLFVWGSYSIWFCLTQQIRFLAPLLPMMVFLAAWGGTWLAQRAGWLGQIAVIVLLIWESPLAQAAPRETLLARLPYLTGQQTRSELLAAEVEPFPVFEYINGSLPRDARVLLAPYENRGYFLDRDYVWANPVGQRVLRFEQIPDAAALRRALAAQRIDYVLLDSRQWPELLTNIEYYDHLNRLLDELVAEYGEPLYAAKGNAVYRLRSVAR